MFKSSNKGLLIILSLSIGLGLSSCQQNSGLAGPQERLKRYIMKTFNVDEVEDRKDLANFLTGDTKAKLKQWSDEQFLTAFLDSQRKFQRLRFLDIEEPSKDEVNIIYELTYLSQKKKSRVKITNKKMATLSLKNGKWFIQQVRNLKELIEYQDEMSLP